MTEAVLNHDEDNLEVIEVVLPWGKRQVEMSVVGDDIEVILLQQSVIDSLRTDDSAKWDTHG